MTPIFKDPDACIAFCMEAETWKGTPFRQYGRAKGAEGGTDCINLGDMLYRATVPEMEPIKFPTYTLDETFHHTDSRLQKFLDYHPRLLRVAVFDEDEKGKLSRVSLLPGDILGFRFGHSMHHLGYSLGNKKFIHCRQTIGTAESWLDDATYERRLLAVYRPLR